MRWFWNYSEARIRFVWIDIKIVALAKVATIVLGGVGISVVGTREMRGSVMGICRKFYYDESRNNQIQNFKAVKLSEL